MEFTVEIQLGNDTMRSGHDIARALRVLARKVEAEEDAGAIVDDNGNQVGDWAYRGSP